MASLEGLIKRKGGGYCVDNKKRGATPSCTSAADDAEETNPEPSSSPFETAPTDERRHDTYATLT